MRRNSNQQQGFAIRLHALVASTVVLVSSGCSAAGIGPFESRFAPASTAQRAVFSNLYVAYAGPFGSFINVYPPGSSQPSRTIKEGLANPIYIGVDASGNLYASNQGTTVTVYARGSSTVTRTLNGFLQPGPIAFDAANNAYIANCFTCRKGGIFVYSPGGGSLLRKLVRGVVGPHVLAFDQAGNLYVGEGYNRTFVAIYPPGATTASKVITGFGQGDPSSFAFDPKGHLFVGDSNITSSINEYNADSNARAIRKIYKGRKLPTFDAVRSLRQPLLREANGSKS